ncbi:hypothetical protein JMM81_22340 [Bacillus sp. V3B]|uniref:hypothetical protein n=1 Tax=Bacillus sp. V3B TaxID=2804915 RepID=UPI00210863E0|nr:hypothetical protein [Bacillus sp. V3B]MCQ6277595.1 hypothetical protein [Bacillus sp. V3B]
MYRHFSVRDPSKLGQQGGVQQSIPYSFYDRVYPPLKPTYLPVCCNISYGQMAKK